jgi:hypothetical protein
MSCQQVRTRFDHVLVRGRIVPTAVLALPASHLIKASGTRLPNAMYPSDHVSMAVELRLGGEGGLGHE